MAVLSVEPGDRWCRVAVSTTEQHGVAALETQHGRRPHVDVGRSLAAFCIYATHRPTVQTNVTHGWEIGLNKI